MTRHPVPLHSKGIFPRALQFRTPGNGFLTRGFPTIPGGPAHYRSAQNVVAKRLSPNVGHFLGDPLRQSRGGRTTISRNVSASVPWQQQMVIRGGFSNTRKPSGGRLSKTFISRGEDRYTSEDRVGNPISRLTRHPQQVGFYMAGTPEWGPR